MIPGLCKREGCDYLRSSGEPYCSLLCSKLVGALDVLGKEMRDSADAQMYSAVWSELVSVGDLLNEVRSRQRVGSGLS